MSWSKYHLRYYHHIVLALWHYHRKKDMSCSDILIKNRNITQRPDVGQSLSISLLCFHCWPKPQSSPLTLQNIGLIKDQFNEITLWGNTSELREKMRPEILPVLLLTVSGRPSVIVNWRVRPDLETDWRPVDHWRYSNPSSSSSYSAQRRNSQQDFGHLVKESFLYSHHVRII